MCDFPTMLTTWWTGQSGYNGMCQTAGPEGWAEITAPVWVSSTAVSNDTALEYLCCVQPRPTSALEKVSKKLDQSHQCFCLFGEGRHFLGIGQSMQTERFLYFSSHQILLQTLRSRSCSHWTHVLWKPNKSLSPPSAHTQNSNLSGVEDASGVWNCKTNGKIGEIYPSWSEIIWSQGGLSRAVSFKPSKGQWIFWA